LPTPLARLKAILSQGLTQTAQLWPLVRAAYRWVKHAARILANAQQLDGAGVKRHLRALLGAMTRHQQLSCPALATMLTNFRKVTQSYWPGLFHCYQIPDLPRTNNDLEQFFGAQRHHERRATGRKGASPALVLRGAVQFMSWAATRLRSWHGEELAPRNLRAWQELRHDLDRRRQQRVHRRRLRRDPDAYLAALEKGLLQLILPS
jgi:hypothetical protein